MRALAYLFIVALAAFIGYAAFAQQTDQSRLHATGTPPTLMAQLDPVPLGPTEPAPAGAAIPAQAPTTVDETALRYFARQGDTVRVQAEIDRLRSLYPNWEPPTNLLSDEYVPDADIVRIWAMLSAGDYAGARAAIAARQQIDPGFVPSDDLLASLDLGEAGLRLRNASDAAQYETVISIAATVPALLTCDAVDNLWRLAEAFARTGNTRRALDAYSYVLTNCTDTDLRYATLQKAMDLLDRTDLDPLLDLERTGEFAAIRLDLARRGVAASLDEGGAPPLGDDVALLEASAADDPNAEDQRLLGWYELGRDRPNEARRWFEKAMATDPSAESAQGLGVALLGLRDPEAAEAVLIDYRDDSDVLLALYLDAAAALLALEPRIDLESSVLGRIVDAVMSARDANAAQELGWYAQNFQQPQTAVEWFTLALRWQADLEPAAYGLMVASSALGDLATVEALRAQWGARSARIASFGRATNSTAPPVPQPRPLRLEQQATSPVFQTAQIAAPAPQASAGARGCTTYVPAASLSAGAALSHAWCLMDLNRPAQAVDHFARALQSGSERIRSDAAYGQSLAFIRLGLADEAAVAAAAAPLSGSHAIELEIAILKEKAIGAYNIGDYRLALNTLDQLAGYAPERNDLLTLRGWSYFHIRRYRDAQRIFEAVAATGYGEAVAGLEAANAAVLASTSN